MGRIVGNKAKLYRKAKSSPNNFRFDDLCTLAKDVGFKKRKGSGTGHYIFKHPDIHGLEALMAFQEVDGKAKPYQVKQLLSVIGDYNLLEESNVPVQD
jgi:hypothetical protein